MFGKNNSHADHNFWISYADLMAGLLFVFILVMGAIVSKSVILKNILQNRDEVLARLEIDIRDKDAAIQALTGKLSAISSMAAQQEAEIKERDIEIRQYQLKMERLGKQLAKKDDALTQYKKRLKAELERRKKLDARLVIAEKERQMLTGRADALNKKLEGIMRELRVKQERIDVLKTDYDSMSRKYSRLLTSMEEQNRKIRHLTGIRRQVIAALKKRLGDRIAIDSKSGALRLSSSVLFDTGSATLKAEARAELKEAFGQYVAALVNDPEVMSALDKIIIEGHTDSDGGYLYNLDLSQRRAYAVMNFLLTLDVIKKYDLKPLMAASGRSYMDLIKTNGIENKEASRRIEIKFRLKNDDAMHEIEQLLKEIN
jgi:chemotaxis protein MotB